jgi:hypothetical protein
MPSPIRAEDGATNLTEKDWSEILSHKWLEKDRLVLEVIRKNGNRPTSVTEIQKTMVPSFFEGRRGRINDTLKRRGSSFFIANVRPYSTPYLQLIRRPRVNEGVKKAT